MYTVVTGTKNIFAQVVKNVRPIEKKNCSAIKKIRGNTAAAVVFW